MKQATKKEIKELNINGILYAKYHIDPSFPGILWIKITKQLYNCSVGEMEDIFVQIIGGIERITFESIAHLNI